ncbi:putative integrase [Paraburkholderia sp. BL6669N2]|uniref:VPA1269 family protein n=1 Tax=Paraburkholderia sp. BL6669N2 TaxID=1938807 RepID=UPI000E26FBC4|nr:VPA1269 family protein [Paraburkholderia sp. BL6669N2]REG59674.1 putative integrase [Paraburkholderia sp. BL6669N2]
MSESVVTRTTASRFGLTVSSHPEKWCALRAATAKEAAELFRRIEVRMFIPPSWPELRLQTTGGIADLVSLILSSEEKPSTIWEALSILLQAELLLMPYADRTVTALIRQGLLGCAPFTASFLADCDQLLGQALPRNVKLVLAKFWLCTTESKQTKPSRELLSSWVHLFLREDAATKGKWSQDITERTAGAFSRLGVLLGVEEVFGRHAPIVAMRRQISAAPQYAAWKAAFERWLDERHFGDIQKPTEGFELLEKYWYEHPTLVDPELLFSSHLARESILAWAKRDGLTVSKATKLRTINQFLRAFVLRHPHMAVVDDWDNDLILNNGYDWPLSNADLTEISVFLGDHQKPGQSNQKALPGPLLREVELVLKENDMAWPKLRLADWMVYKGQRVFCPVLPYLILLLIKLPIRGVQARRLDSGEGDSLRYDLQTSTFIPNDSPHAGYWSELPGVANPRRGVLRQFHDNDTGQDFCGLYINSNKTNDRKVLFSETSGYEMFWQHDEVIEILSNMRQWQETYNPVDGPLLFENVPRNIFPVPSKTVETRKPAVFYIFRYPAGQLSLRESPPSGQVLRLYWYEVLAEVERRMSEREKRPPRLIDSWKDGVPMSSQYHVHGLRVGGLTRLAKAGVHPWILQTIVAAHSGWVMTFYYVKPGFAFVSQCLADAYVKALKDEQLEFAQFLTESTIENVHRAALHRHDDALRDLNTARHVKSACVMATLDNGVCPNGQTRCDEGQKIEEIVGRSPRESREAFGPVPNTVGGVRDCGRCRFFITGTPFLIPTALKCTEISVALGETVDHQREQMRAIDDLEKKRVTLERSGQSLPVRESHNLQSLRAEYKTQSDVLVDLALSLDANVKYFQEIRAAMKLNASSDSPQPVLLTQEVPEFKWGLIHRFEAIDELCKSAKWFKSIRVNSLANERLVTILKVYSREGKEIPNALFDASESNQALNTLTDFLRHRLGRQTLASLIEGRETFESLGIAEEVTDLMSSFSPLTFDHDTVFRGIPFNEESCAQKGPAAEATSLEGGNASEERADEDSK